MIKKSLFALLVAACLATPILGHDSELTNQGLLPDNNKETSQDTEVKLSRSDVLNYLSTIALGAAADSNSQRCNSARYESQTSSQYRNLILKALWSTLAAYNIVNGLSILASESPCIGACASNATSHLGWGAFQAIIASLL